MFSPGCTRVLYRSHSSGRWSFGSHWPNSSRNEKMRSLARAFSSSRRAPPMQASKPNSAMASSSVTDWCRVARIVGVRRRTRPRLIESSTERTISRSPTRRRGGRAIEIVVQTQTASVSLIQRRLRVGYTRAGRLIDMLERRGIISGYEGSKPRRVLVEESDLHRVG